MSDWISHPKNGNGYESLHHRNGVGRAVGRSTNTHRAHGQVAEKIVAHYKYKENKFKPVNSSGEAIESWLMQVREYLKIGCKSRRFINDFKAPIIPKRKFTFSLKEN